MGLADDLWGQTLDGVYQVDVQIGQGGMGAVYQARHLRLDVKVAVKVLLKDRAEDDTVYKRFLQEARAAAQLHHPAIVRILDLNRLSDGRPYIVMEYLEGESLKSRLQRQHVLSASEALRIVRQVGGGLHAAHKRGIVHRDLKPANILLTPIDGEEDSGEQAKVIDFGVAHVRGTLSMVPETRDGALIGTVHYFSPEVAGGLSSEVDGRSDQFSLAVLLYEMLAGRRPFEGATGNEIRELIIAAKARPLDAVAHDIPAPIARAVEHAMARRKEDRFPTIREFLLALRLSGASSSSQPGEKSETVDARPGATRGRRHEAVGGPQRGEPQSDSSVAKGEVENRRRWPPSRRTAIGTALVICAVGLAYGYRWIKPTPTIDLKAPVVSDGGAKGSPPSASPHPVQPVLPRPAATVPVATPPPGMAPEPPPKSPVPIRAVSIDAGEKTASVSPNANQRPDAGAPAETVKAPPVRSPPVATVPPASPGGAVPEGVAANPKPNPKKHRPKAHTAPTTPFTPPPEESPPLPPWLRK